LDSGAGYFTTMGALEVSGTSRLHSNAPLPISDTTTFRVEVDFQTAVDGVERSLTIRDTAHGTHASTTSSENGDDSPVSTVIHEFPTGRAPVTIALASSSSVRIFSVRVYRITEGREEPDPPPLPPMGDADMIESMEFSLRFIAGTLALAFSILIAWFFVFKPLMYFVDF